jgi:hypothetical protein
MNFSTVYLNTLIPELPLILNNNNQAVKRYLDVFYDESLGIVISPINTTGRVKGATGEFVTTITDNLIVKNQWTNLYENSTTIDQDFITAFNGNDVSTRASTADSSTNPIWVMEPSIYAWVDVKTPYIKINNDVSYGFQNNTIGQEFRIIFNSSLNSITKDFAILLESSIGGVKNLIVTAKDSSAAWIKLITTAWDVSYGPRWTIKEYGGSYTII